MQLICEIWDCTPSRATQKDNDNNPLAQYERLLDPFAPDWIFDH